MSLFSPASEDTIAAVSTAVSESGIGIVRISGPDAISIADRVYRSPKGKTRLKDVPTHTIHYGFIVDPDLPDDDPAAGQGSAPGSADAFEGPAAKRSAVDEVLVSVMRAPRSYTAEDVVEISCHGGVFVVKKVLDIVLRAGARAAGPGEFTKRAYLNGRIDLTEAEAVMDVISSKNRYALQNSVHQMTGSLGRKIRDIRARILYQTAHIEAALDDPEHLSFDPYIPQLKEECTQWMKDISHLLSTADSGRLMQEGIRTVIVGKPNAGKSSLLNLLLGEDRAIVTPIAGTTRDILTETVSIDGMTLVITDTAGIHETDDLVEKIGVERASSAVRQADLLLCMIDSSRPLDEDDFRILRMVHGKKAIVLLNKTDLQTVTEERDIADALRQASEDENGDSVPSIISFSASEGTGLDELTRTLKTMFFEGRLSFNDEVIITNARHRALLQKTEESLSRLQESIRCRMPEDFFSIDLMSAYESLGAIIGEDVGEDLVNEIFSRFCMGK